MINTVYILFRPGDYFCINMYLLEEHDQISVIPLVYEYEKRLPGSRQMYEELKRSDLFDQMKRLWHLCCNPAGHVSRGLSSAS